MSESPLGANFLHVVVIRPCLEVLLKCPFLPNTGIEKTVELLQRNYHWLSLWQDIAEYVRMCIPCQQTKVSHRRCQAC
jgi:hypothetical protein